MRRAALRQHVGTCGIAAAANGCRHQPGNTNPCVRKKESPFLCPKKREPVLVSEKKEPVLCVDKTKLTQALGVPPGIVASAEPWTEMLGTIFDVF